LVEKLKPELPKTVTGLIVELRTETGSTPYFHYVHGLKKHDGNCQRIAHGHRSRLKIWRNDVEDRALAAMCARELNYKYIGTKADVVTRDLTHLHFAYTSPQGQFALSYPTERCIVIETDTTIECIAEHIANSLKEEYPKSRFAVRAYEGVMKGAVAEA
jgi:6-pyruvoyl-tetrahydropterin synthase